MDYGRGGLGKRVGVGVWLGWGTVGLGYGWVGVRDGVYGVGQEGRDEGRVGRDWGGDRGRLGCVRVFWGNG